MSDAVLVALFAAIPPTVVGLAAYREAKHGKREAAAANKAVNNVNPGDKPLVRKVDDLIVSVALVGRAVADVDDRITVVEGAVANVSRQADNAAALAASVKEDLDASHHRADAVTSVEPGAAADAAATTL